MDENTKAHVTQELLEMILDVMPDAKMIEKYGGHIVERIAGEAETQCCGYFCYTEHISLEFTRGYLLSDQNDILEGKGKHRRHVKLKSIQDLQSKRCKEFLEQVSNF